jgi:DNA-binding NarL/FixJ family response regulator
VTPAEQLAVASAVLAAHPELLKEWASREYVSRAKVRAGHLSKDEQAEVVRLSARGVSASKLATQFHTTERTVVRIRTRAKNAAESAESS